MSENDETKAPAEKDFEELAQAEADDPNDLRGQAYAEQLQEAQDDDNDEWLDQLNRWGEVGYALSGKLTAAGIAEAIEWVIDSEANGYNIAQGDDEEAPYDDHPWYQQINNLITNLGEEEVKAMALMAAHKGSGVFFEHEFDSQQTEWLQATSYSTWKQWGRALFDQQLEYGDENERKMPAAGAEVLDYVDWVQYAKESDAAKEYQVMEFGSTLYVFRDLP